MSNTNHIIYKDSCLIDDPSLMDEWGWDHYVKATTSPDNALNVLVTPIQRRLRALEKQSKSKAKSKSKQPCNMWEII